MTPEKLLVFLLMLSVLVVLHEFGHFLIARRNGVRVNEFAVGFGPKIVAWTSPRSGTVYRLNWLPLGGYCAMKGEDGRTNQAEQQREFREAAVHDDDNFQAKAPLRRLAIVVAGPIANFLVALVLLFVSAWGFGLSDGVSTTVDRVQTGMPATGVLAAGDRITAVDGRPIADGAALVRLINGSAGKRLRITFEHGGARHEVALTPVASPGADGKIAGHLGFYPRPAIRRLNPVAAGGLALHDFGAIFGQTLGGLGALVTHPAVASSQLQGPIGIARVSAQVQDFGWGAYLWLAAMISVSLGVFNLVPFPALDGGRAAFVIVEMLRGKPVDPEKEALVHVGGFAALILLMLVVSFHDVARIVAGKAAF